MASETIIILISVPVWIAATIGLLVGLVGTFSSEVTGYKSAMALAFLPASSGLFYIASRMCGLV